MSDDTNGDWEAVKIADLKSLTITTEAGAANPKDAFDGKNAYVKVPLKVTVTDEFGEVVATGDAFNAIIGVKGDTNLDMKCDASDAADVLIYAAAVGAGDAAKICNNADAIKALGDDVAENFCYFLSDTDGESEDHGKTTANGDAESPVNAGDAANQLIYAAAVGAQGSADWATDVLGTTNLPKYSAEIYAYTNKK